MVLTCEGLNLLEEFLSRVVYPIRSTNFKLHVDQARQENVRSQINHELVLLSIVYKLFEVYCVPVAVFFIYSQAESANVIPVTLEKPLNQATVDNKHPLCQDTSLVVEEKTLQCNDKNAELAATDGETITGHPVKQVVLKGDEGHEAMKKLPGASQRDRVSTKSAKEGEELVGARSSERNALVIENDSHCCSCTKRSNEEKKLQVQEPIAESLIDKQVANEKLDGRRNSVAETAALVLALSNHAGLKKLLSDDNSVRGYVKKQPGVSEQSRNVEELYRQTAKNVVQNVFARIGC